MSRKSFSTLFFAIKPFRIRGVAGGVIYFVHGARAVISVLRLGLLIASHRAPVVHHSTGRAPSTGSRTFHRRDDTAVDRVSRVADVWGFELCARCYSPLSLHYCYYFPLNSFALTSSSPPFHVKFRNSYFFFIFAQWDDSPFGLRPHVRCLHHVHLLSSPRSRGKKIEGFYKQYDTPRADRRTSYRLQASSVSQYRFVLIIKRNPRASVCL